MPSRQMVITAMLIALTAVGAWIRIPFTVIPVTLQTLFTYMTGAILDKRQAFRCQGIYLLLGLLGAPVFANGGGIGYLAQPTFGYLLALPFAAAIIAMMKSKMHRVTWLRMIPVISAGAICVLVVGAVWLSFYFMLVWKKSISLQLLCWHGFVWLLPGEGVKIITASLLSYYLNNMAKEKS